MPTLLLAGEVDRVGDIATGTRELAAREPMAEFVVVPDAGHASNQDNPAAFTAALLAFLERALPVPAGSARPVNALQRLRVRRAGRPAAPAPAVAAWDAPPPAEAVPVPAQAVPGEALPGEAPVPAAGLPEAGLPEAGLPEAVPVEGVSAEGGRARESVARAFLRAVLRR